MGIGGWMRGGRARAGLSNARAPPTPPSTPDEAGRGPVLGAMVYGAAFAPLADKASIQGMAFADSKALTEAVRDRLLADIHAAPRIGWRLESLSAAAISGAMLGASRASLNALAADATKALIRGALDAGVALAEVFVDTVGDAGRWREGLERAFPGIAFTVCPKADALYPIVSAASIVAKTARDAEVASLSREPALAAHGPLGSGYPGDPDTKAWLSAALHPVFGWPASAVRFSWAPAVRALEERAASAGWEDDPGADAAQATLAFAGAAADRVARGAPTSGAGRASYFRARRLAVASL